MDGRVKIDIDKLTEHELIDLNHRVVERLRFLTQARAHCEMMRFSIGQQVSFDPSNCPTVTGTLTKYNKKTVTVISDEGQRWNVSPRLLRQVEPTDVTPKKGDIKSIKSQG